MTPLLLLALAISGLGWWISRRWLSAGRALMLLGGLGLVGVITLQIRQNVFTREPKEPDASAVAVSFGLANCLLGDLGGQSGSIVLLFPQRRLMDEDTERSYEEGFSLPLRHLRPPPRLRAALLEGGSRDAGKSLSALKQALAQAEDATAIVSFAGAPAGFDSLFSDGQPKIAPMYVFDPEGTTNWLGALKAGHLRAVVLHRPGVNPREQRTARGRPEVLFKQFYLLATPETADQVAAQLSNR
jgi:hypothetical protein